MPFMISTMVETTGLASSTRTAVRAMDWIRERRAAGARQFRIVDHHQREICEIELANWAKAESAEPVWLDC